MWKEVGIVVYLLILGGMDIRERKVPLLLLTIGGIAAIFIGVWERIQFGMSVVEAARVVLLGMLPGGILLLTAFMTKKAGYGDGLVLLNLGCIYGYMQGLAYLCISLLLLSVVSMVLLFLKKVQKDTAMPYIPFLAVTYIGYVVFGA